MLQHQTLVYDFRGTFAPPAVASPGASDWVKKITSAGGNATVAGHANGMGLNLHADNEVQNLCFYMGDILGFDIDDIVRYRFWASLSATLAAASKVRMGLAGARADDPDAIAQSILFGVDGDAATNAIKAECDDGTNEVAATSVGQVLTSTPRKFEIDFASGILTQSPPSRSVGGKYNVKLSMENARGEMIPVLKGTRFNMGAYGGGLQPFFQLQKTASTNTGSLYVQRVEIDVLQR